MQFDRLFLGEILRLVLKPQDKPSLLTRIVESKPPLYWWVLLNVSMACLAVVSWFFFVPTFNYPEIPENYDRLMWLKRTPELPAYDAIEAPEGMTIAPDLAHTIFTNVEVTEQDVEELNKILLRNYIQGIKLEKLNYYLKGTFKVILSRELNDEDIFRKGIVVKARAQRKVENTDAYVPFLVEIEYILPGVEIETIDSYQKGTLFDLHKVPHHCSILHVERRVGNDGETVIYLTVVPLTVSPPQLSPEGEKIETITPERIYPERGLPIWKG